MGMGRNGGVLRAACGAALLLLLGFSGFIGAKREETRFAAAPVIVKTMSANPYERESDLASREKLRLQREQEIRLLTSVAEDPDVPKETVRYALEQKMEIASRMEQEAQAEAALAYMGFEGVSVLCGAQAISVFAPYAHIRDERSRVQILDCVCTQTGASAQNVKIILAKNE